MGSAEWTSEGLTVFPLSHLPLLADGGEREKGWPYFDGGAPWCLLESAGWGRLLPIYIRPPPKSCYIP